MRLKVGAKVLCTAKIGHDVPVGCMGVVQDFRESAVAVQDSVHFIRSSRETLRACRCTDTLARALLD